MTIHEHPHHACIEMSHEHKEDLQPCQGNGRLCGMASPAVTPAACRMLDISPRPVGVSLAAHLRRPKKGYKMTSANDSGQTLIEFAIAAMVFLLLVLGIMDFANLFYYKLTLQSAVRQAGRYAITGQCVTDSSGACSLSRYNSIIQTLQSYSNGILNSSNTTSDVTITCTPQGGGCPNTAGGPGDIVKITVTYPYHVMTAPVAKFFSGGLYTITVSATFTNEPFPPSQS